MGIGSFWCVAMPLWAAMHTFADLPPHAQVAKLRALVLQWVNLFQRTHHNSAQHLPYIHGNDQPWKDPLPTTQAIIDMCRMDGRADKIEGYLKHTRPPAAQHPLCELPSELPADDLYEPQEVPAPPDPPERKHKTTCGQTLSSFPQYRRIKDLKFRPNSFCAAFNERGASKECARAD